MRHITALRDEEVHVVFVPPAVCKAAHGQQNVKRRIDDIFAKDSYYVTPPVCDVCNAAYIYDHTELHKES